MVGIVCFWDRTATPYLQKYEELLSEAGINYEILFWNRSDTARQTAPNETDISFRPRRHPLLKLFDFFRWKKQALKILSAKQYDKLIILTTVPAVLLYGFLTQKYRGKFVLDIRDYTLERNPLFGSLVTNLIEASALTPISSDGYREWLVSSDKLLINHNITWTDRPTEERDYFATQPYRYTFVGNVRLDEQTLMVLRALKNDSRFCSGYVGRIMPSCDIEKICEREGIRNCEFRGEFHYTEKPDIYSRIDLINAVYANAPAGKMSLGDSTPIPNRLYDCVVFRVPIVCCKGTYLSEIVDRYSLGFAIDAYSDDVVACFERYIDAFDKEAFLRGCDAFLTIAQQEEAEFKVRLRKFLEEDS